MRTLIRVCAVLERLLSSDECTHTVLGQIETGEIDATIDAYGSVTFADDEPATVSKAEIDRALRVAQDQEQILRRLEREIARNKDYLQKVRASSHLSVPAGLHTGHFRQCEAVRRARIRVRRLRIGLIWRRSYGAVHLGVVGLTNRSSDDDEGRVTM